MRNRNVYHLYLIKQGSTNRTCIGSAHLCVYFFKCKSAFHYLYFSGGTMVGVDLFFVCDYFRCFRTTLLCTFPVRGDRNLVFMH